MVLEGFEDMNKDLSDFDPRNSYVGTRFVSRLFGVTPQALEGWREHDDCPAQKDGNEWKYNLADIVQWRRAKDEDQAQNVLMGEPEAGNSPMLENVREERWKKLKIERRKMEGALVERKAVERDIKRCVVALRNELEGIGKEYGIENLISKAIGRFLEMVGHGENA